LKTATLTEIKKELKTLSEPELLELCLKLARFKKESKEYLTYLIFESSDEEGFIESVKSFIEEEFENINNHNFYLIRKSVRKILKNLKKFIRFSKLKATEAHLLLHFCDQLQQLRPSIKRNTTLVNTYWRQLELAEKAIEKLHEDLQFDFKEEVERLNNF
jgi:membrane-anchored protein YejM (alkaline phosphatase superfamily)